MNILYSFKKYFVKTDQTEKAKDIISRFASGSPYTNSKVIYVVSQIKQDSPEDPVIKLLNATGRAAFFQNKKEANKIHEKKEKARDGMKFFMRTYELTEQRFTNLSLHEYRDVPFSDEFFVQMSIFDNYFFRVLKPQNLLEKLFQTFMKPLKFATLSRTWIDD